MTTDQPPAGMHKPVDIRDLPPGVVFAALYSVASSPGMGTMDPSHSKEELDLAEAAAVVARRGDWVDYYRGRLMKIEIRDGWLEAAAYDRDNGDGSDLAQAVVDELRHELAVVADVDPSVLSKKLVGFWAREAISKLSPALAWRNTAPHNPIPSPDFAVRVVDACMNSTAHDADLNPIVIIEQLQRDYLQTVTAWALVNEDMAQSGADPVEALSFLIELRAEIARSMEVGLADNAVLEAMLATTKREMARGTTWDAMPAAFEDALIEHTVADLVRKSAARNDGGVPPASR